MVATRHRHRPVASHGVEKSMPVLLQAPQRLMIREAVIADIADIMRLKLELAISDDIVHTVRATPADWERDGFGAQAKFKIFVAEFGAHIVGMAICGERYFPGWVGPTISLYDLCVEHDYRGYGIGTALLGRVAALATACGSVMVELTMRADNPAARLYERVGFVEVDDISTYVIAGPALDTLAATAKSPRAARLAG
jgi:ribosomal protein S18 acetylase RimI-like enzyme